MTRKRPVVLNLNAAMRIDVEPQPPKPTGIPAASVEKISQRSEDRAVMLSHYKITLANGKSAIYHSEHNPANSKAAAADRRSRYLSGRDGIVKRLTNTTDDPSLPRYLALKYYDHKIDLDFRRMAQRYADFHQHLGRLAIPFTRKTSTYKPTKHYVLMEWMGKDLFEYCTNPEMQIFDDQLPQLIRALEALTTEFVFISQS